MCTRMGSALWFVRRNAGLRHLLHLVELAHFGAEDMHDDIASVDQHPVAGGFAFDPAQAAQILLQLVDQFFRDGRDLTRRAARADDHIVADRGFAAQINLLDILGLIIFKRGKDNSQQFFAGDIFGGGAGLAARSFVERQDNVLLLASAAICPGAGQFSD
jgi:hypothetical protein